MKLTALYNKNSFSFFGTKGEFICATEGTCCIELQVEQNHHPFLVDTGASVSAIEYKHVSHLKVPIHKESRYINGLGGKVEAIGYIYLKLNRLHGSSDEFYENKFYVFESLPFDGILGQDFLKKHFANLNLKTNNVSLCNKLGISISLPINSKKKTCLSFTTKIRVDSLLENRYDRGMPSWRNRITRRNFCR